MTFEIRGEQLELLERGVGQAVAEQGQGTGVASREPGDLDVGRSWRDGRSPRRALRIGRGHRGRRQTSASALWAWASGNGPSTNGARSIASDPAA